jgi:hypothetical protein
VQEVSTFSNSLGTLSHVPIVSAAMAYNDHDTGETIILKMIHQVILIDDMDMNLLLCPMQLRMNDVKVD